MAQAVADELAARGFRLIAEPGGLRVIPSATLTNSDRERIRAVRDELLELVAMRNADLGHPAISGTDAAWRESVRRSIRHAETLPQLRPAIIDALARWQQRHEQEAWPTPPELPWREGV